MLTRVQKWGNSLALRIPKAFAATMGLERNVQVEMTIVDGRLIISPVDESDITLADLLSQVTDENLHQELDTGPAVGREGW